MIESPDLIINDIDAPTAKAGLLNTKFKQTYLTFGEQLAKQARISQCHTGIKHGRGAKSQFRSSGRPHGDGRYRRGLME